jgi:hypothetical protein
MRHSKALTVGFRPFNVERETLVAEIVARANPNLSIIH